ncbi:DUF3467 domain-containing protein [bacterium]|jgi:hypothetical protein|nr:DUF3467 domain-containing protein [bacterium]MBT3580952.1 DUF3467 domain-containing protein [bacterium]MBT4551958.1 DUF3467 domain-containing protein [bacterium]MBT5988528.1 DUF3467 domain-containing protein [bacterium]MBT7087423.1 DUF3467 domain-containing protein [bacterium]
MIENINEENQENNNEDEAKNLAEKLKKLNELAKKEKLQIQLDINNEIASGNYSNLVMVNFNKEEFILDFAFLQPQIAKGKIFSRVILNPANAKRLAQMLQEDIESYEEKYESLSETKRFPNIDTSGLGFSVN